MSEWVVGSDRLPDEFGIRFAGDDALRIDERGRFYVAKYLECGGDGLRLSNRTTMPKDIKNWKWKGR